MATKMLSVRDIATRLGLSAMTIYRLIHAGDIPAAQVGRSYRVSEEDLELYLGRVRTDGGTRVASGSSAPS